MVIKAIAVNGFGGYNNLEIADELVKHIDKRACYMTKTKYGTLLFLPSEKDNECNYLIDGKQYETLWTNKYDQLVKLGKQRKERDKKRGYEYITLWEFE